MIGSEIRAGGYAEAERIRAAPSFEVPRPPEPPEQPPPQPPDVPSPDPKGPETPDED